MAPAVCIDGFWPHQLPITNAPCVGPVARLPLPLQCYNPTIYAAHDGLQLIVKAGRRNARLWAIPLDAAIDGDDCSVRLALPEGTPFAGHEDARHFRFRGEDWIAYAGVAMRGDELTVAQALAKLTQSPGEVTNLYSCTGPVGRPVEKNWGFFDHRGELQAVYDIRTQSVGHFHGNRAVVSHRKLWLPQWCGGEMRGGASPVLVDGLWWSFFHGALDTSAMPTRFYSVGCYAFEARRPFRPVLYTPSPIIVPPRDGWPRDLGVSVVWPGGAVWHAGRWLLSLGIHETWSAICTVDHEGLKREMVAV